MSTTFLQTHRRAQFVDVAVGLLAEVGADGASILRIAERAGVSRSLVHYHFANLRALHEAVIDHVYALGADEVSPEVETARTASEALAAFVRRSIHFYAERPRELRALTALYTSGAPGGLSRETRPEHQQEVARTRALLRRGQQAGELRDFDVDLMATTIRGVLDLAVVLVCAGTDPHSLGDELVRTVTAMTISA